MSAPAPRTGDNTVQRGFYNVDNEPLLESEPPVSLEDTQQRKPVTVTPPPLVADEPDVLPEDTQPRKPADETSADMTGEELASGCGNRVLVVVVLLAFACLFVTSVGLAGYAGWRDGAVSVQTRKAATLVSYLGVQATLARGDCDEGRYELCYERCAYVATQQPGYLGVTSCMTLAELELSATPTPSPLPTIAPATPTPTIAPTVNSSGLPSPEEMFARAQEAVRIEDYETAMKWLEALRGVNADFRRKDVEDMLVKTYVALGTRYENEGRLSEMTIVIKKALQIRNLPDDWQFKVDTAAPLYLDCRGYVDGGNYQMADKACALLMERAGTYLDSKALACKGFSGAGDAEQLKKWCS